MIFFFAFACSIFGCLLTKFTIIPSGLLHRPVLQFSSDACRKLSQPLPPSHNLKHPLHLTTELPHSVCVAQVFLLFHVFLFLGSEAYALTDHWFVPTEFACFKSPLIKASVPPLLFSYMAFTMNMQTHDKYRQATDTTRNPRPATPDHPCTSVIYRRIINLATHAVLKRAAARQAKARLQPSVKAHPGIGAPTLQRAYTTSLLDLPEAKGRGGLETSTAQVSCDL